MASGFEERATSSELSTKIRATRLAAVVDGHASMGLVRDIVEPRFSSQRYWTSIQHLYDP
jgi:hypothetical protein